MKSLGNPADLAERLGDHAHHILPLKGYGNRTARIRAAHQILIENGINGGTDIANLVFAKNGAGVHGVGPQNDLVRDIFRVRHNGQAELRQVLFDHGEIARRKQ